MPKKKKVITTDGYMMVPEKGMHKMPNGMMMKDEEMEEMMAKKKMQKKKMMK